MPYMTENNPTPEVTFSVESVPADALTLLGVIRADIQAQLLKVLTSTDERAHVLVSVVKNGVFVSSIIEGKDGKFRFGEITPESIYELYKLKTQQFSAEKGAWFSVQFTTAADGFITQTSYNYDKQIYSGATPEEWYIAPEVETESYNSPWDVVDYKEDIEEFPRKEDAIPEWLRTPDWLKNN